MRLRRCVVIGLLCAGEIFAQTEARPKTWGTARYTTATALASEFLPPDSGVGWSLYESATGGVSRYPTAPVSGRWWAPVRVPDGAAIAALDMSACDLTGTGQILFGLRRTRYDDGVDVAPAGATGTPETGGCANYIVVFDEPVTVDNSNNEYWLYLQWEGDYSPNLRVQALHAEYLLQVSPDPDYATFNDIPVGHPLHRFVEALAYWSITAGCGNGNFCADAPLTRGQMAVFLSKALGL